jgi:hypothetical protein
MKKSDQISEITKALSIAQAAFPDIPKNKEVSAGKYKFHYADLASIIAATRKPMTDNGLAVMQSVSLDGERMMIETLLSHISGQWIETTTPIKVTGNDNQAFGSAQTYGKRYALCAILGVVADDDDDGMKGSGKDDQVEHIKEREKSPPGITAAKAGVTMWARELQACGDTDSFEAILSSNDFKKMVAEVYTKFPSEWTGPEQYSGLRGQIEFVGKQLGAEATAQSYLVKVEKALRQKEAA